MTLTLCLKDHALVLVTGSPGGPTIINTVLEIITNYLDHGMPVQQAGMPRAFITSGSRMR